jgi:hypothetical protein
MELSDEQCRMIRVALVYWRQRLLGDVENAITKLSPEWSAYYKQEADRYDALLDKFPPHLD